ncbi:MAG: hypothetical protein KR126chlam2_00652 [Chlamydiae bacterium]|nr:hypothetical protein [Chlamydiota bacterium]
MNKKPLTRFTDFLYEELRDPDFALEFLNAVLADGDFDAFLLGLKDVILASRAKAA